LRYLPTGFSGGALDLGAQLRFGKGDTFLPEVGAHLVDGIVIASKSAATTNLA